MKKLSGREATVTAPLTETSLRLFLVSVLRLAMPSPQPNRKGGGAAAVAASPASPTSPSKSVEAILAEKRAAAEALQAVANNLHAELLRVQHNAHTLADPQARGPLSLWHGGV